MENNKSRKWSFSMNALEEKIYLSAKDNGGVLSYCSYINSCLYDEQFGYYRKNKVRVGAEGDFFTSSSLKQKVFGKLVKSAAERILKDNGEDISLYSVIELGAEPERKMIEHAQTIRLGQDVNLSGNIVLVSNELIDARPFERFKFQNGSWQKCFVKFSDDFQKRCELLAPAEACELNILEKYFPRAKIENFRLDVSFDAIELFEKICMQNWNGVLIFADYFRFAQELELLPNGTMRTYFKHTQSDDLFSNVGETDITYSPCSDIFEDVAKGANMCASTFTQEQFFVKFASDEVERIISNTDACDLQKRELCQLISPVHMGSCFRILLATKLSV